MPLKFLEWGFKHQRILVRIFTLFCIIWMIIWTLAFISFFWIELSPILILSSFVAFLILVIPPFLPLYYYYHKQITTKPIISEKIMVKEKILDPYLASVKEKISETESYFKGEKGVSWGPVIVLLFDALMFMLQRLIIDIKGIKPIEELRKEKKLYFDNLISILKEKEHILDLDELKELEILRDLRNRVVHEDYRPTKDHAIWAYALVKKVISKYYPEIFM